MYIIHIVDDRAHIRGSLLENINSDCNSARFIKTKALLTETGLMYNHKSRNYIRYIIKFSNKDEMQKGLAKNKAVVERGRATKLRTEGEERSLGS